VFDGFQVRLQLLFRHTNGSAPDANPETGEFSGVDKGVRARIRDAQSLRYFDYLEHLGNPLTF
jgi:hypothetical protein